EGIQQQLWVTYGDRKLFEPALGALAMMIEKATTAKNVRAHIMLPTGRPDNSRIDTYFYGFRNTDGHFAFDIADCGGCSGRCLRQRGPVFADLDAAKTSYADWGLTRGQQNSVAPDRNSMISVPIFAWSQDSERKVEDLPALGALSVDSSTKLTETGW